MCVCVCKNDIDVGYTVPTRKPTFSLRAIAIIKKSFALRERLASSNNSHSHSNAKIWSMYAPAS